MPDVNITAFNSGILSPLVQGRVDYDKYSRSCQEIKNFDVLKSGAVKRRNPSYNIADATGYVRIEPFSFSNNETYLLMFKDNAVRVLTKDGDTVSDLETEYKEVDIPRLQLLQSADVVFITHPVYPVNVIKRTNEGWLFEALDFDFPPFDKTKVQDFLLVVSDALADWDSGTTDYAVDTIVKNDGHYYKALVTPQTLEPGVGEGWESEWEKIGSTDYIYPDMPVTIATDGGVETLSPSYKDAFYLTEGKRDDNTLEVTSLTGISDTIYVKGDWHIRTSGTWTGTLLLQKAAEETPDEFVTVQSYVSNSDTNYNQSGVESEGAFYRLSVTSGTIGNAIFTNQNYYDKGIVKSTGVTAGETYNRGNFYDTECTHHYKMDDDAATTALVDTIGTANATISSGTTAALTTEGIIDNAINLSGKWINLPVLGYNSPLTFAAWIKPLADGTLFAYYDGIKADIKDGLITLTTVYRKGIGLLTKAYPLSLNAGNKIDYNKWSHVAFVITDTKISIYIDGRISSYRTHSSRPPSTLETIGRSACENCIADEVMLFNAEAEDNDIFSLYFMPVTSYDGICVKRMLNGGRISRWSRSLFNNVYGYPASAYIHEGRLWFTGSKERPNIIIGSKISDYYNFETGANDDDAILITLDSGKVDQTHWLFGVRELNVGSASGEWSVRSSSNQKGITPSTINVKLNTTNGSLPIRPVSANGRTIFIQGDGKTVRDLRYDYQVDGNVSEDISVLIDNLFTSKVKEIAFQQYPNDTLYLLLEDGKLVCITYDIANNIIAGYRYEVLESVVSVCVLNSGDYEELYLICKQGDYEAVLRLTEQDKYQEVKHLDAITTKDINKYDDGSEEQINVNAILEPDGSLVFEFDQSETPIHDATTLKQSIFMYLQEPNDGISIHLLDKMYLKVGDVINITGTEAIGEAEISEITVSTIDPDDQRSADIPSQYRLLLKDIKWSDYIDAETLYQYGSVNSRVSIDTFPIVASSDGKNLYFAEKIERPDEGILATQTITIGAGVNWISFYILPDNPTFEEVFADYTPTLNDVIVAPDGKNAAWTGSAWIGTLVSTPIYASKCYRYISQGVGSFTVSGNSVDISTEINLVIGSNFVGYPLAEDMTIADAMANLDVSEGDYIQDQAVNRATYTDGEWVGDLSALVPGTGYLINVAKAQTFTYPNPVSYYVFKLYQINNISGDTISENNTPITLSDIRLTEADFIDGIYSGGKIIHYDEIDIDETFEEDIISGMELYAGKTVRIYGLFGTTESYIGEFTVSNTGVLLLPSLYANEYIIGIEYQSLLRTVRIEVPAGGQTTQSNIKRISRIVPRVLNTTGISIKANDQARIVDVSFSNEPEDIDENIMSGYDSKAMIELSSIEDKPLTVLSAVVSLEYRQ